jgi:flagellar biogenesis protein FliO
MAKKIFLLIFLTIFLGSNLFCQSAAGNLATGNNNLNAELNSKLNIKQLNKALSQPSTTNFVPQKYLNTQNTKPGLMATVIQGVLQLLIIAGFAYLVVFAFRYLRKTKAKSKNKVIKVLETQVLGSRQSLHLVEIGNQLLLIGSSDKNLCYLTEITDDNVKAALITDLDTDSSEFDDYLQSSLS